MAGTFGSQIQQNNNSGKFGQQTQQQPNFLNRNARLRQKDLLRKQDQEKIAYEEQQKEYEEQIKKIEEEQARVDEENRKVNEYNDALESVKHHYEKGNLWAIAGYGSDIEKEIAKRMIKEGYSSNLGGKLEQIEYKTRIEDITKLGEGDYAKGLKLINLSPQERINQWQQENPSKTLIFDNKGNATGYSEKETSYSFDALEKEYNRLSKVMPLQATYNAITGQLSSSSGYTALGKRGLSYNALVTPSGDLIKDPAKYYEENKIPTTISKSPIFKLENNKIKVQDPSYYNNIKMAYNPDLIVGTASAITGNDLGVVGTGGLALVPVAIAKLGRNIYSSYYEYASMREDKSISAKAYRGVLGFSKTALLFSNPVTAIPSGIYFGSELLVGSLGGNPIKFVSNSWKGIKDEPFEFAGNILGGLGIPKLKLTKVNKLVYSFDKPNSAGNYFGKGMEAYIVKKTVTRVGVDFIPLKFDFRGRIGNLKALKIEKKPSYIQEQTKFAGRSEKGRATLLLLDDTGKKIALGKSRYNEYISLGGKVNKGETVIRGLLREMNEESGLLKKDLQWIKKFDKYGTPEETQGVYLAKLKPNVKLNPKSDIINFKWFNIDDFKGVTGGTARNPLGVKRGGFFGIGKDNVRLTEAVLINRMNNLNKALLKIKDLPKAENYLTKTFGERAVKGRSKTQILEDYYLSKQNQLPTELYIKTNRGKIFVGLQSRYDVPFKVQRLFSEKGIKSSYNYKNVKFKIEKMGLSFNKLMDQGILKVSKRGGRITYNKPQLMVSGTANKLLNTERNLLGQLRKMRVGKGIAKRGGADGLYLQPPTMPSKAGYLGSSYILASSEGLKLSLLPKFPKRTILYGKMVVSNRLLKSGSEFRTNLVKQGIRGKQLNKKVQAYLNKNAKPNEVVPTAKTFSGAEEEFLLSALSDVTFTGKTKSINLAGKFIKVREIRKAPMSRVLELKNLNEELKNAGLFKRISIKSKIRELGGLSPQDIKETSPPPRTLSITELMGGKKGFESSSENNNIKKEVYAILKENYSSPTENYSLPKESYNPFKETYSLSKESYNPPIYDFPTGTYTSPKETYKYKPTYYPQKDYFFSTYYEKEEELKKKLRKKKKKRFPEMFGLIPDFTARSIGLDPQEFGSVEDAVREIKRLKTGFEVSRGGRLKTGFKMPKGIRTSVRGANVKKVGDMDINLKGIMA